jgi:hypothetical protein
MLRLEEHVDRLLEPAGQEEVVPLERDVPLRRAPRLGRQVEAMDRVQKKQRPHPLVQVPARTAEAVQLFALGQQVRQRRVTAERVQRQVADGGVVGGDDAGQVAGHLRFTSN